MQERDEEGTKEGSALGFWRERGGKDSGHPVNFPYNQYQKVLLTRDACPKGSRPDTP